VELTKQQLKQIIQEEIDSLEEYEEVNSDKTEDGLGREKHKATPKRGTVDSYLMHTELEEMIRKEIKKEGVFSDRK